MNDKILFVAISILFLHFVSLIILNADAYFLVHDNLDSEIAYLHILSSENKMFDISNDSVVGNVMNGIPRSAFRSGLDITALLFYILPTYKAYILNYILVHLVGFIGMFLLLRTYFVSQEKLRWVVILCSLIFSFAGYYTIYGITTAGLPLLSWAFLNLRYNKPKGWINFTLIVLYVFWSLSFLIAPFILFCLFIILLYDTIKNKRVNWNLVLGSLFYVALVALVNYQLIYTTLMPAGFESHRSEWKVTGKAFNDFVITFINTVIKTPYHVGEYYTPLIIVVSALAYYYSYKRNKKIFNTIFIILTGNILIAFFLPLSYTIIERFSDTLRFIKIFQINRFYFLLSFAWILVFAIAIQELSKSPKLKFALPLIVFLQFFIVVITNPEVINNSMLVLGYDIKQPVYSEFVARELFSQIKSHIKRPKKDYRIVNIGIHPSAAQLNGFYTLDSYQNNYPLSYKHEFRKIIAPELEKNTELRQYFDFWGNRCYIFTDELGPNYLLGKDSQAEIKHLNLNTEQLKLMGCEYIFSTVRINEPSKNNIVFEKRFTSSNAFMDIYLYKII